MKNLHEPIQIDNESKIDPKLIKVNADECVSADKMHIEALESDLDNAVKKWREANCIIEALKNGNLWEGGTANDLLPPVGCDVAFETASSGRVIGTVTGYRVWPSITHQSGEESGLRVFVKMVYKGTDTKNERLLSEVFPLNSDV